MGDEVFRQFSFPPVPKKTSIGSDEFSVVSAENLIKYLQDLEETIDDFMSGDFHVSGRMVAPISIVGDGSVTVPSMSFINSTDSGLYKSSSGGADTLHITLDGAERMRVALDSIVYGDLIINGRLLAGGVQP